MEDLRDIRGRVVCLAVAALVGIVASLAITFAIPDGDFPRHFATCSIGPDGRPLALVLAGAVAITLAVYAMGRRIRHG